MASNGMRVRGITIEINADMTGVAKAFKSFDSQTKRLQYNLSAISNYINTDKSWSGLGNKFEAINLQQDLLSTKLAEVKNKLDMEKIALEDLKKGDQTEEVTKRQRELQTQIILDTAEVNKLEQALRDFGSVAQQKIKAVGDAISESGEKLKSFGQSLTSTGRSLSMYVTTPIVGIGTAAVKSSMEFESAMDKVQSVTLDATAEDMERLSAAVLEMSGQSKYSAAEASEALYYMGLAGWNVEEMLSALPQVLAVATAGEMDLGRASDIVTDYFTAFGEGAGTVEHMVDVMARTMVSSNTDIDQLGDAFKYVAPVAGAMGFTIEDVSFALGLMANNGIKASQAGTSLRQFMQRLVKPTAEVQRAMDELGITVEDDEGNIKSFRQIMDELRASLNGVIDPASEAAQQIDELNRQLEDGEISEEEYSEALEDVITNSNGVTGAEKAKNAAILAGVRGMSGLLAIVNATTEDYNELSDAIEGTTTAQDIANVMIDNTQGRMQILKHSAENLGISFGQVMAPYIEKGISALGGLVQKFSELDDGTKDTIVRIAGIAAAVGPLLVVCGSLISSIGTIMTTFGSLVSFVAMNPVFTILAVAIGAAVYAGYEWQKQQEAIREATYGLSEEEKELISQINTLSDTYQAAKDKRADAVTATETEAEKLQDLRKELGLLVDETTGRVLPGYEDRVDFILGELNDALGTEYELNGNIIESYQGMQDEIDALIEKKRGLAILEAYEESYVENKKNQKKAYEQLTDATDAYNSAHEQVVALEEKEKILQAQLDKEYAQYGRAISGVSTELAQCRYDLQAAQASETELRDAMELSQETYQGIITDIYNYETAQTEVMNGTTQSAKDALDMLLNEFKRVDTATEQQLKDQLAHYQKMYEQSKIDLEKGVAGISQATVDGYAHMVEMSQAELDKLSGIVDKSFDNAEKTAEQGSKGIADVTRDGLSSVDMTGPGSENIKEYIGGMNSQQRSAEDAAKANANATKSALSGVDMSGPGSENISEYIFGMNSMKGSASSSAFAIAQGALASASSVQGDPAGENFSTGVARGIKKNIPVIERAAESAATAGRQRFNRVLDIQSPSKVMMESGKFFDEGFAIGIERNTDMVVAEAEDLARETAAAMSYNTASPLYGLNGKNVDVSNRTFNLGGVSIQINQQPGESAEDLAEIVMDRINREVQQRQVVFG